MNHEIIIFYEPATGQDYKILLNYSKKAFVEPLETIKICEELRIKPVLKRKELIKRIKKEFK